MRAEFTKKIRAWLDRGESVQVIAPPGFGKSRFGRALGGLYLDVNLLQTCEELLSEVKKSSERRLIVLDPLDQLLAPSFQPLFKYLKAVRDQHKYQLAYVFLASKLVGAQYLPILNDLYEIASEHVEYLPPLAPPEYDLQGFSPTPEQLKEIEKLSGGIPALLKICIFSFRDGTPLDPDSNPKLKAQLEEMLSAAPDHPAYSGSSLVSSYLNHFKTSALSASETRLLDLLLAHPGQIVSKDQIAQAVYPDVKNYNGVSDHALDQLVHRLRSKVSDKYSLQTHRGLGYCLNPL